MSGYLSQLSPEVRRQILDLLTQLGVERERIDGILGGSSTVDHGSLIGLGDNDHPQYALLTALQDEATLRSNADTAIQQDVDANAVAIGENATALNDHVTALLDAHPASAITFTPAGSIEATNTEAAIFEVAADAAQARADLAQTLTAGIQLNADDIVDLDAAVAANEGAIIGINGQVVQLDADTTAALAGKIDVGGAADDVNGGVTRIVGDNIEVGLQTLTAKLAALDSTDSTLGSDLDAAEAAVAAAEADIVALQGTTATLQTDLDTAEAALAAAQADLDAAEADVAALQGTTATLTTDLDAAEAALVIAQADIVAAEADIVAANAAIAANDAELAQLTIDLNAAEAALVANDADIAANAAAIAANDTDIAANAAAVASAQADLDAAEAALATAQADIAAAEADILTKIPIGGAAADVNADTVVTVDGARLTAGSVTADQIAANTITATEIAANTLTAGQIAAGAITTSELATNSVTAVKILAGTITGDKLVANTITATQIATNTITASEIAASAVTASELAAGAVVAGKIAAGTIVAADIAASTITGAKIAANTVTATNIAADTITASEIASNAITANELAASSVTAGKIAANAVTATTIAANAVTTAKIAAGAITADEIGANAVTTAKLAAGAVTADKVAANTITANEIASNTITAAEIGTNAVNTNELAAGAITTAKIAAGAVTATEIAASAVTAEKVAAGAITAGKLDVVSTGDNLIADPSFEGTDLLWSGVSAGGVALDATYARSGSQSAKLTLAGGNSIIRAVPYIPVEEGETYVYGAWVYMPGVTVGNVRWRTYLYNPDKTAFSTAVSNHAVTLATEYAADWTYIEYKYTIPAGVGWIRPSVQMYNTPDSPLWLDDVSVWRQITATNIQNGAVTTNKLYAEAVTADKILAGTITAAQIAGETITGEKIAANTIVGGNLVALTVTAAEIASQAVTAAKIAAAAIDATHISADAIESVHIKADVIETGMIKANQITTELLALDAVQSNNYTMSGGSGNFSGAGSYFNLADGDITTPGLFVDGSTGDVAVKGDVTATDLILLLNDGVTPGLTLDPTPTDDLYNASIKFKHGDIGANNDVHTRISWNTDYDTYLNPSFFIESPYGLTTTSDFARSQLFMSQATSASSAYLYSGGANATPAYAQVITYANSNTSSNVKVYAGDNSGLSLLEINSSKATFNKPFNITDTSDVHSGGGGGFQIGSYPSGQSVHMDGNELQCFNLGSASDYNMQLEGGMVNFGGTGRRTVIGHGLQTYWGDGNRYVNVGRDISGYSDWFGMEGRNAVILLSNPSSGHAYFRNKSTSNSVFLGVGTSNRLEVKNAGAYVTGVMSSTSTTQSTRQPTTSWDTANIIANPSTNNATMSFHPGGIALQLRVGYGVGTMYVRNSVDSGTYTVYAYHAVPSSGEWKHDVQTWGKGGAKAKRLGQLRPDTNLSGAPNTADEILSPLDVVKRLRPVAYRLNKEEQLDRVPPEKSRQEALGRLNEMRRNNGQGPFVSEETLHLCGRDCDATPDDPCVFVKDWEKGKVGFISEELAEILPEAVRCDPISGKWNGIDTLAVVSAAVGAIQEQQAVIEDLQRRIEVLENRP